MRMEKNLTFFIQSLDNGYILTRNGTSEAIEKSSKVKEIIADSLSAAIERFSHTGVSNMLIEITVHENCPQSAN